MIVTGSTGGVGRSVCRHLNKRYQVIAIGRDKRLLDELGEELSDIFTMKVDLGDNEDLRVKLDELADIFPSVPFIINNAGVNIRGSILESSLDDWEYSIQVNALSPLKIMRRFIPDMQNNDFGRIVNITSGSPLNCFSGFGSYSTSKAALNAITVTAAKENAEFNIKINLMSPGPVKSGMAPHATMDPSVCHSTLDYLLGLGADGPTGRFFWLGREVPLNPDLSGIDWLQGKASSRYPVIPGIAI